MLDFFALVLDEGEERIDFFIFSTTVHVVNASYEVADNVHIIRESIVGTVINTTVTAGTCLGGHETEVVGSLEVIEILLELLVLGHANTFCNAVEFIACFLLHLVAEPGAEVAFFIHPRGRILNVDGTNGLVGSNNFAGSAEGYTALLKLLGECFEEFEDVAAEGLEDTESAEFHEEVDALFFLGGVSNPLCIAVSEEGIFVPAGIVETETDVFRKTAVAEENSKLGIAVAAVNIVGALPTEDVLCTFCEDTLITEVGNEFTDFVAIA